MLHTIPDSISNDETHLKIKWKDEKESSYDLLTLRKQCPCAHCRGGHDANSIRVTDGISEIRLVSWKKVGRYAIQITWSDNHDSGIFTYDALREASDEEREYKAP